MQVVLGDNLRAIGKAARTGARPAALARLISVPAVCAEAVAQREAELRRSRLAYTVGAEKFQF